MIIEDFKLQKRKKSIRRSENKDKYDYSTSHEFIKLYLIVEAKILTSANMVFNV